MSEQVDKDLHAVRTALVYFHKRADELFDRLGDKKSLSLAEREEITLAYAKLKTDLKDAARRGTVGRGAAQNQAEQLYFEPAVRAAALALRPSTNSNPIASNWASALYDVCLELSYAVNQIEKDIR